MELPNSDGPPHWLTQAHVEVVRTASALVKGRKDRELLREIVLGLTNQLSEQMLVQALALYTADPMGPMEVGELELIEKLVTKGVYQNGVAPQLSATEVGKAVRVLGELLARAHVGMLSLDDQAGLEWIFDVAAEAEYRVHEDDVRRIERLVRAALGLAHRLDQMPPMNEEPA